MKNLYNESFIIFTLNQILFDWSNQGKLTGLTCSIHEEDDKCIQSKSRKTWKDGTSEDGRTMKKEMDLE
jgi:hypothetical protein